jgi:hypothetical protein
MVVIDNSKQNPSVEQLQDNVHALAEIVGVLQGVVSRNLDRIGDLQKVQSALVANATQASDLIYAIHGPELGVSTVVPIN